ncbi:MAG TPA: ABC transporter permease, partial [Gemmatimonadaceae bacterium]|nr:ABC transporter permease [Gemmatimonadaceae bacterium]
MRSTSRPLPRLATALVGTLLPRAEREEVLADLGEEYGARVESDGALAARRWLWRQVFGSLPALLRRSWWRGWTGFEPRANRMRPGGPMLESWIMDARYAARRLVSRPTYALLAVLTLALGAGGTAAIFSVARTVLLEPLPIRDEGEVDVFWMDGSWNEAEFLAFRPHFPGFRQVAAYRPNDLTLETGNGPLRLVTGIASSAELFDVLGAAPVLGRGFRPGDDVQGAEPVVVVSYGLWQELGGGSDVVGRRLRLGGTERTVVGVMPRGFWFPDPTVRIWTAAPMNPENQAGQYTLVGRREPGATAASMTAALGRLTTALGERFDYPPDWDKTRGASLTPVRDFLVGSVRPALLATLGAMAVILLIAAANVAALMLGQVDSRSTELSVRAALGAGRRRLTQQLV